MGLRRKLRKLIPKEIAGVLEIGAPIAAASVGGPWGAALGATMGGLGSLKRTGSFSPKSMAIGAIGSAGPNWMKGTDTSYLKGAWEGMSMPEWLTKKRDWLPIGDGDKTYSIAGKLGSIIMTPEMAIGTGLGVMQYIEAKKQEAKDKGLGYSAEDYEADVADYYAVYKANFQEGFAAKGGRAGYDFAKGGRVKLKEGANRTFAEMLEDQSWKDFDEYEDETKYGRRYLDESDELFRKFFEKHGQAYADEDIEGGLESILAMIQLEDAINTPGYDPGIVGLSDLMKIVDRPQSLTAAKAKILQNMSKGGRAKYAFGRGPVLPEILEIQEEPPIGDILTETGVQVDEQVDYEGPGPGIEGISTEGIEQHTVSSRIGDLMRLLEEAISKNDSDKANQIRSDLYREFGIRMKKGGRAGYDAGGDVNAGLDKLSNTKYGKPFKGLEISQQKDILALMKEVMDKAFGKAQGGRVKKAPGGLMNLGGLEKDYRTTGGFVPIGKKEKADDVPARLSKNEFVMTADAVRAAGGGNINKGAQRMYNTMKQLEGKRA